MNFLDLSELQCEAKIQFDIEDYASQLEFAISKNLLDPPKGIYIASRLEPAMIGGKPYFSVNKKINEVKQVFDIKDLKEDVYDDSGNLVIPKAFMVNKQRYLSNTTVLPYRGLKIIELIVKDEINNLSQYQSRDHGLLQRLRSQLVDIIDDRDLDGIHDVCIRAVRVLLLDVDAFIGKDTWHMYSVKLLNRTLTIEKLIDFRVYDWYRIQNEKNNPE